MVRIRITNKEMYDLILQYGILQPDSQKLFEHIFEHGFIFDEFTLIWEKNYTYKVRIEGLEDNQIIHVKKIWQIKSGTHKHLNFDFTLEQYLENMVNYLFNCPDIKSVTKKIMDETWSVDYTPVINFMLYSLHNALNQEVIIKDHAHRVYKSHSNSKKNSPKMEYTLTEVVKKYAIHINHTKHNITCSRWEVKGHLRHYKNGRVIWIAPYPKGKDKTASPKSKEYRL